jgi:hypothetical protein
MADPEYRDAFKAAVIVLHGKGWRHDKVFVRKTKRGRRWAGGGWVK